MEHLQQLSVLIEVDCSEDYQSGECDTGQDPNVFGAIPKLNVVENCLSNSFLEEFVNLLTHKGFHK